MRTLGRRLSTLTAGARPPHQIFIRLLIPESKKCIGMLLIMSLDSTDLIKKKTLNTYRRRLI
jgi:hypothetical protein